MDPISNVDRLVLLLRQRIQDAARARSAGGGARGAPTAGRGESSSVAALAATAGVGESQLRRAVIQQLLADQFGASLINEAKFQQVVDRVTEAFEGDRDASQLMSLVTSELRQRAR